MEEELVARLEERSLDRSWPARALEAARLLCLADDLTAWEERLAASFVKLSDVQLVQAVADALATHYLKQGRLPDFEALLGRTRYADSLLRGFESVGDPEPALGLIARHNPRILAGLLSKRPDLLKAGLDAAFREAPESLPGLLQDLALWRRRPLEGALELMLELLERGTPASRRATSDAFRLASEAGADVSALGACLPAQTDPETCRNLAYALALSACRLGQWRTLDELMQSALLREGALKALHVAWVERGQDLPEIATRVVRALPTSEGTFMEALRRGRAAQPDEEAVRAQTEPSAALYWLMVGHPERALGLAPQLEGEARRVAEEIAAGRHRSACWICRNLPRRVAVTSRGDLPREVDLFGLDLEGDPQRAPCPECGTLYSYRYEREYDDMSLDETFELERQRPAPTPALLEHLDPNLRREGAWSMTAEADTATLARLLASPHPEVREEALLAVRLPLPAELEEGLSRLLPETRALSLLTRHYDQAADWPALQRLLEGLEPDSQARLLAGAEHAPAGLALEPALLLLGSPNEETGRLAAVTLRRLKALQPTLQRIDELWNKAACGLWNDLAQDGEPVESLMEAASRRLAAFDGRYSILLGLQALARRGKSLEPALEALASTLADGQLWHINDLLRVAGHAVEGREHPPLVAALGQLTTRSDRSHSVSGLLASASQQGWDMEPAAGALANLMRCEGSYEREMAARAWTLHLLRRGRLEEIATLLARGVDNVRGAVAATLAESGMDYAPLALVLEQNREDGDGYTRECADRALKRIART